jgi:hypothetical protein
LLVTITSFCIQLQADAPEYVFVARCIKNPDALLKDFAGINLANAFFLSTRLPGVLFVFPDNKKGFCRGDPAGEINCAEISIRYPAKAVAPSFFDKPTYLRAVSIMTSNITDAVYRMNTILVWAINASMSQRFP